MLEKGYKDTATFIQLMHNWFNACNEWRLRADEWVEYLYDMHTFLLKDIKFSDFPSVLCGRYIRGMPVQTWEAILQLTSTQLYLYSMAHDNIYNTRSVSTLASKSFFADLKQMDKEGHGYPKAANMDKVIGKTVNINAFKHKANK